MDEQQGPAIGARICQLFSSSFLALFYLSLSLFLFPFIIWLVRTFSFADVALFFFFFFLFKNRHFQWYLCDFFSLHLPSLFTINDIHLCVCVCAVSNSNLPFNSLSKFGPQFVNHLRLKLCPVPLLKDVILVDSPGIYYYLFICVCVCVSIFVRVCLCASFCVFVWVCGCDDFCACCLRLYLLAIYVCVRFRCFFTWLTSYVCVP